MNPMLSGIRILDLSRLLPGPFCTLYLAQLGAEVIKIEEPQGGDYTRLVSPELFALINRGKQSVTLDLRKPEGAAIFRHMAEQADVVVESFRPGVMDRLGCGYETLKARNRRLVWCAITGYGQSGPYRDRAGHDANYCGYAGALDQIGVAGSAPALGNTQIADLAGGALTGAIGLLAAVIGAKASGEGAFVDVGMLDGTLTLQTVALGTLRTLGHTNPRGEDMLTGGLPNYSVYECADGKHLALGALESKFWVNFCVAAGRPELAKRPLAPGKAGAALRQDIAALVKTRTRDEWEQLVGDKDACASGVYALEEALGNEQVRARGLVETTADKPAFASPIDILGQPKLKLAPAPKLGADTAADLGRFGCNADQLAALRQAKAV